MLNKENTLINFGKTRNLKLLVIQNLQGHQTELFSLFHEFFGLKTKGFQQKHTREGVSKCIT